LTLTRKRVKLKLWLSGTRPAFNLTDYTRFRVIQQKGKDYSNEEISAIRISTTMGTGRTHGRTSHWADIIVAGFAVRTSRQTGGYPAESTQIVILDAARKMECGIHSALLHYSDNQ